MFKIISADSNKQVFKILLDAPEKSKSASRQSLRQIGMLLKKDIKSDMNKGKSGIKWGRNRRSGADDEGVRRQTGKLSNSTDYKVSGYNNLEIGFDSSVDYGKFVEFGSKRMGAKKPIINAINRKSNNMQSTYSKNVSRIFDKV